MCRRGVRASRMSLAWAGRERVDGVAVRSWPRTRDAWATLERRGRHRCGFSVLDDTLGAQDRVCATHARGRRMNVVMASGTKEMGARVGGERNAVSRGTAQLENSTSSNEQERGPIVPCLVVGTKLLGAYSGSGFATDNYLLGRSDGRMLLVSPVVYAAANRIDGRRTIAEVAEQVSADLGRRLDASGLAYLIEAKLRPLGVVAGDGEASPANAPAPLLSLGLRCTLIPPRVVGFVAKILAPLFFPPIVVAVLSGFILIDVVLFAHHSVTGSLVTVLARPGLLVGTIGIVAGAMLFHELGHAAACSYGGGRPGRVGMGVYTLLPAFFTNVNDSYRLSRAARLRVDLGGIYFNAIFVLASGTYAWRTGSAVALAVTGLVLLGMLQQLLPLGRLDGYFVVSDLVGVPDLFNRIGPALRGIRTRGRGAHFAYQRTPHQAALRPKARLFVWVWAVTVVPALCFLLGMFVWRLPVFAVATWDGVLHDLTAVWTGFVTRQVVVVLLAVISLALLVLPFAGMTLLAGRTLMLFGSRATRMLDRASRSAPGRRSPSLATIGRHFNSEDRPRHKLD